MKGRKRYLLVDTLGLLLAIVVTSAAVSDPAAARLLLRRLAGACKKLRRIWVDGTERGQLLEWVTLHFRFILQLALRCEGQRNRAISASSQSFHRFSSESQAILVCDTLK